MPQLQSIQLDDGTLIYIKAAEDVVLPPVSGQVAPSETPREQTRTDLGTGEKGWIQDQLQTQSAQSFQAIESTIKAYTTYTLRAFRQVAIANVDKVTLEFGIEIGGEAGVPYVTKGTAKSNLKITVECSFPQI
ncbi:MAG: CU044_2847 family protein [Elainella sp.]